MASARTFYRTIVTIEVLSEEPTIPHDLDALVQEITTGDFSGKAEFGDTQPIDGKTAALLLHEQGSDPGFFRLTEHGDDLED